MKKLVFAMAFSAALFAKADTGDYLVYWNVSSDYVSSYLNGSGDSEFNGASLFATLSDNSKVELTTYFEGDGTTQLGAIATQATDLSAAGATIASFYIEYFNYNSTSSTWTSLGTSETWSYSEALNTAKAITDFRDTKNMVTATGALSASSFSPVPEPTSGLLMLLGLAGLALRRKNAKG